MAKIKEMKLKSKKAFEKYFKEDFNKDCDMCIERKIKKNKCLVAINVFHLLIVGILTFFSIAFKGNLTAFMVGFFCMIYISYEAVKENDRKNEMLKEELK